jgi:hypothetical protein
VIAVALLSPEETKTVGVVVVMVSAFIAAVLYPVARAFARRLEGRIPAPRLQQDVAELAERMDRMEQDRERLVELEGRLDFTERLLAQRKDPSRIGPGD